MYLWTHCQKYDDLCLIFYFSRHVGYVLTPSQRAKKSKKKYLLYDSFPCHRGLFFINSSQKSVKYSQVNTGRKMMCYVIQSTTNRAIEDMSCFPSVILFNYYLDIARLKPNM